MKRSLNDKKTIMVICGGVSPEHVISLVSASSVVANLDKHKYSVNVVAIDTAGLWRYYGLNGFCKNNKTMDSYVLIDEGWEPVSLMPGKEDCFIVHSYNGTRTINVDAVFPVVHGDKSEDGLLQGLIESLNKPIVGCATLASAIGMDKHISKILANNSGVPVVPWIYITEPDKVDLKEVNYKIGFPLFVKPNSSGSSFGITKVSKEESLLPAIHGAFKYSDSVILEKAIDARELEVAVLGMHNKAPKTSVVGEIIPKREFYNFEAKYLDKNGAELIAPAELETSLRGLLSTYAVNVFNAVRCDGMARVDFFVDRKNGNIYFNELNTIPGFTTISMYPKLWQKTGLEYRDLLDELINIALKKYGVMK